MYWAGLDLEEMPALVKGSRYKAQPIHHQILFELTDGHPAAALEILSLISEEVLTFPALLGATRQAALDGAIGKTLLTLWRQLPEEAQQQLRRLVLRRHLVAASGLEPKFCNKWLVRLDRL